MKKVFFSLALVALSFTACKEKAEQVETQTLQESSTLDIGKDTPETPKVDPTAFSPEVLNTAFQTVDGQTVTLKNILDKAKGKPALIDIWATWCPDCITAIDGANQIKEQFPSTTYIYLSLDKTTEKWLEGVEKYQLKGENYYLLDPKGMRGEFGAAIDLNWIPRYIIVDKDSNIALYRATEKNFEQIKEILTKLN